MYLTLTLLLIAVFSLLAWTPSSAQTVNALTGVVCESPPHDVNLVRDQAKMGDAAAEYELGRSMLSINPTVAELERAFATAVPWIRRSAEQGYAPAEFLYGYMFTDGRWRNPEQVLYWWTKAAEHGEARAQLFLGLDYEQGRDGAQRDYAQALKWLSMAAKQGQTDAQATLGQMYEDAEGIPQDYRLAAYWYRRAADHDVDVGGAGMAASSLAELYRHGHANPQDYVFVYLWYAYVQNTDSMRDVTKKMNSSQIADAQRRVSTWVSRLPSCP